MKKFITWVVYSFPRSYNILSKISQGLWGLFSIDLSKEKGLITKHFPELTVVSWPFRWLRYKEYRSGIIMPAKLAGGYEKYLEQWTSDAIAAKYDTILNVWSAEWYYSVGFAKALPEATVYAFDTSIKCQQMCRTLAALNETSNVHVAGEFRMQDLDKYAKGKTLLLCDIEWGERQLLDPALHDGLKNTDIIVECHDFLHNGIVDTLLERFFLTHSIEIIGFQSKDSALYNTERVKYGMDFTAIMDEPRAVHNQKWLRLIAKRV